MAVTTASAAGAAFAACSRDGRTGSGKLDRVTYLTSFGNLGRDAYIHAAVHMKYFAEVGIEVNVQYGQAEPGRATGAARGGARPLRLR